MIIDIHTHVGSNAHVSASVENLTKEMRKNGVDYAACFVLGADVTRGSIALAERQHPSLFPFFRFDPKTMTEHELTARLPAFHGVKFHPRLEEFDPLDAAYHRLFEIIESFGKPVLIHTRKENNPNTDPDRLLELVRRYPKINFIFGHFANDCHSVLSLIRSIPNVYVETSIVSSPKIIEMAVKTCGSEKILFGSDFPYSDQELELQKVLRSQISLDEKENILFKNAARLLRFNTVTKKTQESKS